MLAWGYPNSLGSEYSVQPTRHISGDGDGMTLNISLEQLEAYMLRQEKRFEESQIRIMETLMQKFCLSERNPASSESQVSHTDSVINAIHEFIFDGVAGITFESWFKKYEDLFYIDL